MLLDNAILNQILKNKCQMSSLTIHFHLYYYINTYIYIDVLKTPTRAHRGKHLVCDENVILMYQQFIS